MENAGFEAIFANDIESAACETLRANRELRRIPASEIEAWFGHTVIDRRRYGNAGADTKQAHSRWLRAALKTDEHYLTDAGISEEGVREPTCEEILRVTGKKMDEVDLVSGGLLPTIQPGEKSGGLY